MVTIRSMARPFGRVRPRRDVVNDPAGGRRSGRGRVGRRDGGGGRERGFGRVGSSIQGDTPVDQTGVQDGQAGRGRQAGVRGRQQARDGRAVEREAVLRRAEGGDDPEVQPGLGEGIAVHLEDGWEGFEAGLRVDTRAGGAFKGFTAECHGGSGRRGRRRRGQSRRQASSPNGGARNEGNGSSSRGGEFGVLDRHVRPRVEG